MVQVLLHKSVWDAGVIHSDYVCSKAIDFFVVSYGSPTVKFRLLA